MPNQRFKNRIPDDVIIREAASMSRHGAAKAGEWYPQASPDASAEDVSFATSLDESWTFFDAHAAERQVCMRPALIDKQKPAPKKIPARRSPTLQIELELPLVPPDEREERAPERIESPSERGVAIVDFYI